MAWLRILGQNNVCRSAVRGFAAAALLAGFAGVTADTNAGMVKLNWQFNDGLSDASGTGNDGSYYDAASGSPTYVAGVFGNAIDLNSQQTVWRGEVLSGSSAPIDLPANAADAWTVNVWVSMDTLSTTDHVVVGGFGSDPGGASIQGTKRFIRLRKESGNPINFWGNSGTYDYTPGTTYSSYGSGWHMLTAAYTGSTLRMYVDGVQIGSDYVQAYKDAPGTGTLVARVGGEGKTPPVSATAFDGVIDDFSIWSVGLEGGELKAMASVPFCGISELTGYDAMSMEQLVDVYQAAGAKTNTVGSLTWAYAGSLTGHNAGDIWKDATTGYYYMQFGGDSTSGLGVMAVPEPATMGLLAIGGLVLARRQRGR